MKMQKRINFCRFLLIKQNHHTNEALSGIILPQKLSVVYHPAQISRSFSEVLGESVNHLLEAERTVFPAMENEIPLAIIRETLIMGTTPAASRLSKILSSFRSLVIVWENSISRLSRLKNSGQKIRSEIQLLLKGHSPSYPISPSSGIKM